VDESDALKPTKAFRPSRSLVPYFDDAIACDTHRIEGRPLGTKDWGPNGLFSAGGDDAALVLEVHR
jgi:hypothetical protein